MKYKLDITRDVDVCHSMFSDYSDYMLNLPSGFRFYDEIVHVRGFNSMAELKQAAKNDVILCYCKQCTDEMKGN
jgi:hypothetical protein